MTLRLPDAARAWLVLVLLSACALALYVGQFEDTNAYIGIVAIRPGGEPVYWLLAALWLWVAAMLFPWRVRGPADLFLSFYLIGTALWSATYWPATGLIGESGAVALAVLLLLPALVVSGARWLAWNVRLALPAMTAMLPERVLIPALCGTLGIAALLGYRVAGADAGFDVAEAFLRRLGGRDTFAGNALAAYLMQMSMNGLAPFLAFLGGLRRSKTAMLTALAFAVFGFWLLAAKAPILNVVILALIGTLVRAGRVSRFSTWLLIGLGAVLLLAIAEMFASEMSLIAEFGVRRAVLVSSTIQVYFFDALSQTGLWSLLDGGVNTAGYASPEYFIGATYLGHEETNANTNAFLHQFATGGVFGYLAVVAGTAAFLFYVELRFVRLGRRDGFALSAMLGILMIEQALTTALVSSGVLLCLLFSLIFAGERAPRHRPSQS
jgi:hypothetical protein